MPRKKLSPKEKHIIAKSITLFDTEGKARIYMDAGSDDGYASINLYGKEGGSVQIGSQSNGTVTISALGKAARNSVCISMNLEGGGGISITNTDGKLGTILGEEPETKTHVLRLFKDGQIFWNTPSGKSDKKS